MQNWCPTLDLCLLAQGKVETFVIDGAEIYDFCAGKLIASEAGAVITDFSGHPFGDDLNRFFIAGNTLSACQHFASVLDHR